MDKTKIKILVVDDEQGLCAGLQEALQREGHRVDAVTDPQAALKLATENLYDLVISDIKMPGLSGLELLTRVREKHPDTLFILMTAYGTVESAVAAMKQGAYDYLSKPIDMKRLRAVVQKAMEFQAVVAENKELRLRLQKSSAPGLLIGESEPMRTVARLIGEVANSDVTVLIEGESGTGKEIVARAIHAQSPRQTQGHFSHALGMAFGFLVPHFQGRGQALNGVLAEQVPVGSRPSGAPRLAGRADVAARQFAVVNHQADRHRRDGEK